MEQFIKIDPLTGDKFVAKRTNQRFACIENKIRYHNRKNAEMNKERAFIEKPCKQSHLILKAIYNPKSDNIYNRYFLEGKGLRFDAFNRIVDTKYGKLHAYYEYAIRIIPNSDNVQIIKL
jgi:hypothetical protein